jgi:hypothetical protein
LRQVFEPDEARRMIRKLEFHHTAKHGSWRNIAVIELSVLSDQCLDGRLPEIETVRFTAENARVKLKRLYPS